MLVSRVFGPAPLYATHVRIVALVPVWAACVQVVAPAVCLRGYDFRARWFLCVPGGLSGAVSLAGAGAGRGLVEGIVLLFERRILECVFYNIKTGSAAMYLQTVQVV